MGSRPFLRLSAILCLLAVSGLQQLSPRQIAGELSLNDVFETEILYRELSLQDLSYEAFQYGLLGYRYLEKKKYGSRDSVLTIIDYSLPSTSDRFFVIDLRNRKVLYRSMVAHGRNSGNNYAQRFSNRPGSLQSSLGFFITAGTYEGRNGYSLWLDGVDTTFNDNARSRAVVIHGADYVSGEYIARYGRIGRSYGCPALPASSSREMINTIKNGSVVFSYYPDGEYLNRSRIIQEAEMSVRGNLLHNGSVPILSSLRGRLP